jgi:hypothetical protein
MRKLHVLPTYLATRTMQVAVHTYDYVTDWVHSYNVCHLIVKHTVRLDVISWQINGPHERHMSACACRL